MTIQDIYHYVKIDDRIVTAGQPSEEQLKSAAAEGFQAVINLAPHDSRNALPDEAGTVASTGMTYHHIPVMWENPEETDFKKFSETLNQLGEQKVLIHCVANYRVTAFLGLYAMRELKWSQAQADQLMANFWARGEYPIWDQFIDRMKAQLKS